MIGDECPRELDVLEAIAFGRWPDGCRDLATHAAACKICTDVVEVALALHDDRAALCRAVQPPSAGMVWWRATIRARAEAARTATKPISVLQGIAGACIVGAAAGLLTLVWQSMRWMDRLGELAVQLESRRADIATAFHVRNGTRSADPDRGRGRPGAHAARALPHVGRRLRALKVHHPGVVQIHFDHAAGESVECGPARHVPTDPADRKV